MKLTIQPFALVAVLLLLSVPIYAGSIFDIPDPIMTANSHIALRYNYYDCGNPCQRGWNALPHAWDEGFMRYQSPLFSIPNYLDTDNDQMVTLQMIVDNERIINYQTSNVLDTPPATMSSHVSWTLEIADPIYLGDRTVWNASADINQFPDMNIIVQLSTNHLYNLYGTGSCAVPRLSRMPTVADPNMDALYWIMGEVDSTVTFSTVPEPSLILLLGMGLGAVTLVGWRSNK